MRHLDGEPVINGEICIRRRVRLRRSPALEPSRQCPNTNPDSKEGPDGDPIMYFFGMQLCPACLGCADERGMQANEYIDTDKASAEYNAVVNPWPGREYE